MNNRYREPFAQEYSKHANVKIYDVSIYSYFVLRIIPGWIKRNLRHHVDKKDHVITAIHLYLLNYVVPDRIISFVILDHSVSNRKY